MDYVEKYFTLSSLSSYMTGTITGLLKWNDNISLQDKKLLAKQLLWCYETSGAPMSDSVKQEIQEILSK